MFPSPTILPSDVTPCYRIFRGKQDLEKNLVCKLQQWRLPQSSVVVLRDQDLGDCHAIKQQLTKLCQDAGTANALVKGIQGLVNGGV